VPVAKAFASATAKDLDGIAETEADHHGNCPVCGAYLEMRDLAQVLAHIHDAEIETCEGSSPCPGRRSAH
jgi:hypothetical protein